MENLSTNLVQVDFMMPFEKRAVHCFVPSKLISLPILSENYSAAPGCVSMGWSPIEEAVHQTCPCPLKLNPCLQSVGSSLWGLLRSKQLCIAHWNKLGELGDVLETTLSQLWSALRSKQLVCAHCPAGNQGSRLRRTHFYHHSPNTSTMQTNTAYTFHVLLTLPLGTFCTLWCTDSNWDDSGVYIIPLALC